MEFPSLNAQIESVAESFPKYYPVSGKPLRYVIAPYRICPIGAHVDHQGGFVLGRTINAYTVLAYVADDRGEVRLRSTNYPGELYFQLNSIGRPVMKHWGRYARGAAQVLVKNYAAQRGIQGMLSGTLPASGLSSSASVGLAYLHAFAHVNELALSAWNYIELDRQLENDYLGLANGILDQSIIELSRQDSFIYLDTLTKNSTFVLDDPKQFDYRFLIVYSGYPRDLISTGYNHPVKECKQAAELLGNLEGISGAEILSDIPVEVFNSYKEKLPLNLKKRARHYFGEVERVKKGHSAWETGDIEEFGRLMDESCESSIYNYESGNEPIKALHHIFKQTPGAIGSRFSGGGYGGCEIGLVKKECVEEAKEFIENEFKALYPEKRDDMRVFIARFEGGVRSG
jgi:galactokinase/galacturonokinase